jgi:subtilisin family serine protease
VTLDRDRVARALPGYEVENEVGRGAWGVVLAWKDGGHMRGTGNSYAAPHIAGIAALIRSKHPELRPFQVKTVLWATAANVRDAPRRAGRLTARGRTTSGSIRASAALRAIGAV